MMVPESTLSSLITAVCASFLMSARIPLNVGAAWSMRANTAARSSAANIAEVRPRIAALRRTMAPFQKYILCDSISGPCDRHVPLQLAIGVEERLDPGDRQAAVAGAAAKELRQAGDTLVLG